MHATYYFEKIDDAKFLDWLPIKSVPVIGVEVSGLPLPGAKTQTALRADGKRYFDSPLKVRRVIADATFERFDIVVGH